VIEEVFRDRITTGVSTIGVENLLNDEPSQKETQATQDIQEEDSIAVDTSDRKTSSIPTLTDESSDDSDNDLDAPTKTAISKLKRRAPVSTPPLPKKVKIETAASQLSTSNNQIAHQLTLANAQRTKE
jgi:hypothetical protein